MDTEQENPLVTLYESSLRRAGLIEQWTGLLKIS